MPKPSIAELLKASGFTSFTPEVVTRAINALHGNVGANADERDWSAIMASGNPLAAAETALTTMYQDRSYLLRNADQLVQNGYLHRLRRNRGRGFCKRWLDGWHGCPERCCLGCPPVFNRANPLLHFPTIVRAKELPSNTSVNGGVKVVHWAEQNQAT